MKNHKQMPLKVKEKRKKIVKNRAKKQRKKINNKRLQVMQLAQHVNTILKA